LWQVFLSASDATIIRAAMAVSNQALIAIASPLPLIIGVSKIACGRDEKGDLRFRRLRSNEEGDIFLSQTFAMPISSA
jgi:hypothetical protein